MSKTATFQVWTGRDTASERHHRTPTPQTATVTCQLQATAGQPITPADEQPQTANTKREHPQPRPQARTKTGTLNRNEGLRVTVFTLRHRKPFREHASPADRQPQPGRGYAQSGTAPATACHFGNATPPRNREQATHSFGNKESLPFVGAPTSPETPRSSRWWGAESSWCVRACWCGDEGK